MVVSGTLDTRGSLYNIFLLTLQALSQQATIEDRDLNNTRGTHGHK